MRTCGILTSLWITRVCVLVPGLTFVSSLPSSFDSMTPKDVSRLSATTNTNNSNNSTATSVQSAKLSLNKPADTTPKVSNKTSRRRNKPSAFAATTRTTASSNHKKPTATVAPTAEEAASLRRIQNEWKDMVDAGMAYNWKLQKPVLRKGVETTTPHHVWVGPLSKNLWTWHFSFLGIEGTAFESGIYHGRLLLPKNYPGSPPRVQVFTPTGRFVPRADICLSASHFHPETWSPKWTVRTLIESLRLHMLTAANEIGGMEATRQERQELAQTSRTWNAALTSSIRVNHTRMVEQGLFPVYNQRDDENDIPAEELAVDKESISTVPISFRDPSMEWQHEQQPFRIAALFKSPIKVALLGLCLLFVILNTT